MRHSVFGRQFSRNSGQRKRLFTGLVRDLFVRDAIVTTVAKAKAVQPIVEKLITKAKTGTEVNRRYILGVFQDKSLAVRLMDEAKTRFTARTSGYTRIIKLGKRGSDASDMAHFSFVDARVMTSVIAPKKSGVAKETKPEKKIKVTKPAVKKTVKKTVKK
jgi:large subunit ribosomal protein L17